MPYSTGSVNTATALKSAIESFCVANGWTLTSGVLSKLGSQSFIRLTMINADQGIKIEGAFDVGFTTGVSSAIASGAAADWGQIFIPTSRWPVVYHLFALTNPDTVMCAVVHDSVYVKWLAFGDMVKVDSAAFTGGNWFAATYGSTMNGSIFLSATDTTVNHGSVDPSQGYGGGPGALFWEASYSLAPYGNSWLHAEIDGRTWVNNYVNPSSLPGSVTTTRSNNQLIYRGPNLWNGQTVLVPIRLDFYALSNFLAYLGFVEHIRYLRIDNYNLGDIITLGSDRWKVFPWIKKSSAMRNGGTSGSLTDTTIDHSGTFGFAVRYDGP